LVLGDALLMDRGTGVPVAHVENPSDSRCRPVHSADCVICRVVANHLATPIPASDLSFGRRIAAPLPEYRRTHGSDALRFLSLARAPPIAVVA
jgi:hypothetical protein